MRAALASAYARRHRHRYLLVGASFLFGARDVRFDTPRALRHMRRRNCHQLFGLVRNRAVLEDFLVEFQEALERIWRVLTQVAEILRGFLAVKICHRNPPRAGLVFGESNIADRRLLPAITALRDDKRVAAPTDSASLTLI